MLMVLWAGWLAGCGLAATAHAHGQRRALPCLMLNNFPPSMRMQVLNAAFHTKIGLLLMAVSHFSPTTAATEAFICLSAAIANDDNITTILGYTNSIMDHADHAIVTTCCNKVVACAHAVQAKLVAPAAEVSRRLWC
jgi:hypothetical protein